MIAFLSGKIISVGDGQIVLKIPSGVGYLINTWSEFLVNENLEFFIWQSENKLFGFETFLQRNWAESLASLAVSPEIAAEIVWKMGENKISQALIYGDSSFFEKFQVPTKTISKIFQVFGNSNVDSMTNSKIETAKEAIKSKTTKSSNLKENSKNKDKNKLFGAKIEDDNKKIDSIWQKVNQKTVEIPKNSVKSNQNNFGSKSFSPTSKIVVNHSANFGKNKNSGILSVDFTQQMTMLGYSRGDIVSSITMLKSQNYWENTNLENLVEKAEKLLKNAKIKNEKLI